MSSFLPLITGGAGAIVVLALVAYAFYIGKLHSDREFSRLEAENEQLREAYVRQQGALETERRAANSAAEAGQVTNQLITALTAIAADRKAPRAIKRPREAPGLPGEDLVP